MSPSNLGLETYLGLRSPTPGILMMWILTIGRLAMMGWLCSSVAISTMSQIWAYNAKINRNCRAIMNIFTCCLYSHVTLCMHPYACCFFAQECSHLVSKLLISLDMLTPYRDWTAILWLLPESVNVAWLYSNEGSGKFLISQCSHAHIGLCMGAVTLNEVMSLFLLAWIPNEILAKGWWSKWQCEHNEPCSRIRIAHFYWYQCVTIGAQYWHRDIRFELVTSADDGLDT